MKRMMVVLAGTVLMLMLTITAVGSSTTRSPDGAPKLIVAPLDITVLVPISTSTVATRPLLIDNAAAGTILTWTIALSPSAEIQPSVATISGTNAAVVNVQIAVNPISITGLYTAYVIVNAEPTTTLNAPITIPVQVLAVESLHQTYLPVIVKDYQAVLPPPAAPPMGLDYISSPQAGRSETRYQRALAISGTLNRWPIYWNEIETQATTQPRVYNWTAVDNNLVADINHGLTVLPILMFTPAGLDTGGSRLAPIPQVGASLRALMYPATLNQSAAPSSVTTPPRDLYEPIFADNSDIPGPGKSINPHNSWAYFVNAAVNRYRPGSTLAQQQGWTDTRGVRYWEIWNEPDLDMFFTGTITDYARLLKVAYLSARAADPQAQIVLGGLSQAEKPAWFSSLLNLLQTDPSAVANHYFMDKVAVHTYFWAWDTFGHLYPDRVQLDNHGLQNVALWLTEVGLPVCGDASFPACNDPQLRWYRASPDEQAAYLIQSATYAKWLNTEAYLWFQLFDDCGNLCGVDAYGLVRNDNTTRLAYKTYPLVNAQLTNVQPYWRDRRTITATNWISGNQEIIALKRPATGERIVVMWTRYYTDATVILTATAPSAQLYFPDGSFQTIFPLSGTYAISLPLASNRNFSGTIGGTAPDGTGSAPIGGPPRILVESDPAVK
jgi:hypothetical protein